MTTYDVARDQVAVTALDSTRSFRRPWERRYITNVAIADVVAAALAGALAYVVRFGDASSSETVAYVWASVLLPLLWFAALGLNRAYEPRYLGVGSEEFRRVISAGVGFAATVAIASYATRAEVARGYVLLAIPLALGLTLWGRHTARRRLHRERAAGRCVHRVIAVGHEQAVINLVHQVRREPHHGINVVGACLPRQPALNELISLGVPVVGDFDGVAASLAACNADTVAVLSCPELEGRALRRLAWSLEGSAVDLIVAPGLIEVAGPRLTIRPADGLPLLHVEQPRLSGAARVVKGCVDRGVALVALVLLAPALLAIAIAVRLTSPGPALFRQTRAGLRGEEFPVFKFRTMIANAEQQRDALLAENIHGDGILFKVRRDPRVTPLGTFLRRWSLDELPQLLNVATGEMSLVGPRPPLPSEVARYGDDVWRRMLVKPGLTGLWQVSGRSNLSWEESVRLDLRYVENWSLALDAMILWKTGSTVLRGRGAY